MRFSTMLSATAAAAVLSVTATAAQAAILFDNGPVVTGGVSILTTPATTLGFGSNASATLADNFTISGASWNISSLDFYGYQTNAGGFTFTNVTWSIVSGTNVNTGTVLASGTTAVTNAGLVGYRASSTTPTDQTRAIYRINADITDITLGAGNYFVTWALAGTAASGPFVPPVVGSQGTGNALQSLSGAAYTTLTDAGSGQTLDVPFTINGTVAASAVPEPATWAMMIGGFGMVGGAMRSRRRKTTISFA
ncbi:PEPxxWA-CTERM sorting domain-containing protein [Sphingomonas sp. GB1N7]|uniref:PEPxxWA-CTERM sorting domain-containing protein n=1 Tax=Parasphingomonas caseinilytica TaxID=3096158 RepID=UPI002FCBA945